jgi:hypothetical protein
LFARHLVAKGRRDDAIRMILGAVASLAPDQEHDARAILAAFLAEIESNLRLGR